MVVHLRCEVAMDGARVGEMKGAEVEADVVGDGAVARALLSGVTGALS